MLAVYDSQYGFLKMFMVVIGYTYLEGCKALAEKKWYRITFEIS